jgi:hypothetical protein
MVRVGFGDPGATWTVTLRRANTCAHYPAMLTPTGDGTYEMTASGAGARYLAYFAVRSATQFGGTSGAVRWTTPGNSPPNAWVYLHQNGFYEHGAAVVRVVLDGSAVDGQVRGDVTVSGALGTSLHLALFRLDQGCRRDRWAAVDSGQQVSSVLGQHEAQEHGEDPNAIDHLGPGPFTYDLDIVVDGTHHHATATSVLGAEDTPLTFEPPLPQ